MLNREARAQVGVLGAGIMGCCLALELARRGRSVDLFDLAATPMLGASLHNEGKLHLGYVYAKDPHKETHGLMLRGSLSFARIVEGLTGACVDCFLPSQPFHYFVPVDSQLHLDAISEHFEAVERAIVELERDTGDRYLGKQFDRYSKPNAPEVHGALFSPGLTQGSFATEERSVSPSAVADVLRKAVADDPKVNFIGNTQVLAAIRRDGGDVEIDTRRAHLLECRRYPCVANCLWDDKLRVDHTAGVGDQRPWLLRYKATITISATMEMASAIPSATGILGSYGDVVNRNDGSFYISWYPLCKRLESRDRDGRGMHDRLHSLLPRGVKRLTRHAPALSQRIASLAHRRFVSDNIRATAAYVPAVGRLQSSKHRYRLGGGVILARGATDIVDPNSYLHQRSVVGPTAFGAYITIDTGKYCTAPLFALEAADLVTDVLGGGAGAG